MYLLGWLSRHLGGKSIISYKIIAGGLRRESRLISLSSKLILRLTHPTNYKILLSPQLRESHHRLDISLDGQTTSLGFDDTGGWQSWENVIGGSINLAAGTHEMRLEMGLVFLTSIMLT